MVDFLNKELLYGKEMVIAIYRDHQKNLISNCTLEKLMIEVFRGIFVCDHLCARLWICKHMEIVVGFRSVVP